MKHLKCITIILLALILTNCRSIYNWKPKGPFNLSGPVKQIIVDKNNSNKLFAATENGGVWVNENYTAANNSWKPITDQLENLQTRGFDVSERFPDKMIVGNGLGNLHISYDAGENWRKLGSFNYKYIRKIAIDDVLGSILIFNVASQKGLYKVEVRGEGENPLILMDTISNAEVLDFVIDKNSKNVRYYSARNEGVYKSIDYGNNWKKVLPVDSTLNEMIKIAQPHEDGTVLFKVDRKLFLGNNNSNVVTSINFPDNYFLGSDVGYRNTFGGRKGDWDNAVAIHPNDSKMLFVGMDKLGFSRNQGEDWSNIYPGHEDLMDIKFINDDVLVANDGGIFKLRKGPNNPYDFKNSSGNLLQPFPLNNGLNTYQFYRTAVNGNIAVGNADHNGIKFTQNLNSESPIWENVNARNRGYGNNGLENDFIQKDIKNPNRVFVAYRDRSLVRLNIPYSSSISNDITEFHDSIMPVRPFTRFVDDSICNKNGIEFKNCNQYYNNLNYAIGTFAQDPKEGSSTMLLSAFNSNNRIINEQDEFYIKITKNGNLDGNAVKPTWTESHNNGNKPIVSIAYATKTPVKSKNSKAYALDESGKFLINTNVDNNGIWQVKGNISLNIDEVMRQLIVNKNNTENLFAISHQRIFKSTNEGASWRAHNFSVSAINKINSITQHHKDIETYFVATDIGVYYTENSGDSWSKFGKKLPNATVMQIFTEGKYLYAVTFGRGLWRCDLENPRRVFFWQTY